MAPGASSRPAASSSPATAAGTGRASLALRPERLALMRLRPSGMDNSFPGTVEFVSYLGSLVDLHVRLSPSERVIVQIAEPREAAFAGDRRTGPHRLEQIDRPGISMSSSEQRTRRRHTMTRTSRSIAVQSCSAAQPLAGTPACRCRRSRRPRAASSSAPGAATMPACSTRTSRTPLLKPKGWEVVQDQAGDPERRSKMLAEKRAAARHHATCRAFRPHNMFQMNEAGRGRARSTMASSRTPATCCRR